MKSPTWNRSVVWKIKGNKKDLTPSPIETTDQLSPAARNCRTQNVSLFRPPPTSPDISSATTMPLPEADSSQSPSPRLQLLQQLPMTRHGHWSAAPHGCLET
jgi:hypothetical protein